MGALLIAWLAAGIEAAARTVRVGFDDEKAGQVPGGFTCALTGRGRPGVWTVLKDDSALSPPHVLAQTDGDPTSYRFPVCVLDTVSAVDVDLAVRFKAVGGAVDRAAGLVWRFRDPDNYYVLRANALEGNVVLYKVVDGRRTDIDPKGSSPAAYGKKAKVPSGAWLALRVLARGNLFEAYLDGEKLFEAEDSTFTDSGKIGAWTKADSVTSFDDLSVTVLR